MIRPLFLIFLFGVDAANSADTEDFEYRIGAEAKVVSEGLGVIQLDRDIFSRTEDHFRDLRLVQETDGVAQEVPFVVERVPDVRPGSSAAKIPSKVISFDQLENGDVEIRVRLEKEKGEAAMMELKTPLRNFEKSVSVGSIGESGEVTELVAEKLIFDYESFLDFRRTTIVLPENPGRDFLVRISKATDKQRSTVKQLTRTISPGVGTTIQQTETTETRRFRIDELSFYTAKIPREDVYSIRTENFTIVEVSEDEKQTEILFQGDRAPVDSLIFQTSDRNFKRRVEIQVPVDQEEDRWRTIHTGSIYRYDLGEIEDENLMLSFSEERSDLFRVLLHNRDSPPITIEEISGVGEIYELRFIVEQREAAVSRASYHLLFGGGERVEQPDYDVAAIVAANSMKIGRFEFKLGPVEKNSHFKLPPIKGPGLNQPWILWIAIGVAVVGLLMVLLKTAKHIDQETD